MRIDHIAYRTSNRVKTAEFFIQALGYKIQQEFPIPFDDGTTAQCIALEPPEKLVKNCPWKCQDVFYSEINGIVHEKLQDYHMAPEIFVSDGEPGSIVYEWVQKRDGIGGIHHIAYQVDSVEKIMEDWKAKGYAEFTSDVPMRCPGLTQVFTKPSTLTGVIYEFIERGEHGFCSDNVKNLMESTKGL
jgi:4-hydroxyphenylpyruvate dioxygenase-like putative hemolysin